LAAAYSYPDNEKAHLKVVEERRSGADQAAILPGDEVLQRARALLSKEHA
jgi:hypothetical protein